MSRFKIIVEYNGTGFYGWQQQIGKPSIQGSIQNAIKSFCNVDTEVYGCGRTDAGVHAYAMPAHFDLPDNINKNNLQENTILNAINFHLDVQNHNQIKILSVKNVDNNFHARFDCKKRNYVYKILIRKSKPALLNNFVWHLYNDLSIEDMKAASEFLIGKHDFTSFRSVDCQSKSPIKTLDSINFKCIDNSNNDFFEKHIDIYFSAKSFLHHQVRNMVGSLVDVGLKKIQPDEIKNILKVCNRRAAGVNAPAYGLYFLSAEY